jgi:hypothetical protein
MGKGTQITEEHGQSNIFYEHLEMYTQPPVHLFIFKTVKTYEERVVNIKYVSFFCTTYV